MFVDQNIIVLKMSSTCISIIVCTYLVCLRCKLIKKGQDFYITLAI